MKRCLTGLFRLRVLHYLASALFAGSTLRIHNFPLQGRLSSALEQISVERMLADIKTLSGPAYGGQAHRQRKSEASATFVANRFSELQLHRTRPSARKPDEPLPQREWKQTASGATRRDRRRAVARKVVTPPARQRRTLQSGSRFCRPGFPFCRHPGPVVFVGCLSSIHHPASTTMQTWMYC